MSVQKPRPRFGYRPEEHVPSTLVEQLQLTWYWYESERPWIPTQEDIDAWDAKAQPSALDRDERLYALPTLPRQGSPQARTHVRGTKCH